MASQAPRDLASALSPASPSAPARGTFFLRLPGTRPPRGLRTCRFLHLDSSARWREGSFPSFMPLLEYRLSREPEIAPPPFPSLAELFFFFFRAHVTTLRIFLSAYCLSSASEYTLREAPQLVFVTGGRKQSRNEVPVGAAPKPDVGKPGRDSQRKGQSLCYRRHGGLLAACSRAPEGTKGWPEPCPSSAARPVPPGFLPSPCATCRGK